MCLLRGCCFAHAVVLWTFSQFIWVSLVSYGPPEVMVYQGKLVVSHVSPTKLGVLSDT